MQKLERDTRQIDSLSHDPLYEESMDEDGFDSGGFHRSSSSHRKRHSSFTFFGSTAQVPFPEVLKEIALQELSGDLQVISGRAIRTLYFNRGFIVFASSNLKTDRLGQRLLESGKVTERELELACRMMKGRRRIGEAMIEAGLLTEEDLGREVSRQAKRIILSSFSLKNGIYSFDERQCTIPMDLRLGLSIYRIQLDGIRRMTNGHLILQGLGSLHRRLRLTELPPFTVEEADLRPVERKVISATQKGGALDEILTSVGEGKGKGLRAAYGLLCAGILEFADMAPRELKVQEETEAFLLSSLDKSSDRSEATNVRQEVLLQFDSLEQATPGELLDVDESADDEVIAEAYETRRKEWEKKQNLLDNEKSLYVKVEEIKRRLAEAHEAILEKSQFPPLDEAEEGDPYAGDDSVEFELADMEEPEITAQEDFDEHSDESVEGPGEPSSEMRLEPAEEMPLSEAKAVVATPAEESRSVSTVKPSQGEARNDIVKRLLYDIKVRKAVNDDEGAISLLYELVELVPESVKYELMLANSMAAHSVLNKKAERHYRRALSLDPQNAKIHYRLGLYYKSFNMKSRALAEFKTTLRIDPSHSKARAGLVDLKKDSSGTMENLFKKILG